MTISRRPACRGGLRSRKASPKIMIPTPIESLKEKKEQLERELNNLQVNLGDYSTSAYIERALEGIKEYEKAIKEYNIAIVELESLK